jgi:uncharacterized protein
MKIVIAGATGLIVKMLTEDLLASKHSVVVLTRNPRPTIFAPNPILQIARWSGKEPHEWHQHIEGADAIVNLSGESLGTGRWTADRKRTLISSRIDPTKALIDAMRVAAAKPEVFLNASAVGYYGPVNEGDVTEDYPAGNDFAARLCAQWEQAALEANNFGVRTVLLRSGIVLDPNGGALQKMMLPFRFFAGGPLGTGNQWLPWIHREDEIRAIRFALENGQIAGPVNLAAPEAATMRTFSAALGRALRRPSAMRVPAFVLRVLLGEMADMVLTGQRVVPQKLLQAGFTFRFPGLKEALENLLME